MVLSSNHNETTSSCRVFVFPFRTTARIQPFRIRRKVPEFLTSSGGVETESWQQLWKDIDQAAASSRHYRVKSLLERILAFFVLSFGYWVAAALQLWTCEFFGDYPVVEDFLIGICFDDVMQNPFLAFCYGFVYEACALYYLVQRRVLLMEKRDKILRNLADKVRYVCDDWNDSSTVYLRARQNYDLEMIVVDVYQSKPSISSAAKRQQPAAVRSETKNVPNPGTESCDPLLDAV